MPRIRVPQPPHHNRFSSTMIQEGLLVSHIWVFTDPGMATIETQYATAQQIAALIGCSRATAYRIINRHKKRYWLCDLRPNVPETCVSVLPREALHGVQLLPLGNPNFSNGIYQQEIARKRRCRVRR